MNFLLKVLSVFLLLYTNLAQASHDEAAGAKQESPAVNQAYTPGLGEIMVGIQLRHAKLWFAGLARNWRLAKYELDEILEGFDDAKKYQPDFKGKPIAEMIGQIISGPINKLEQAIESKDKAAFKKSFDGMSNACNACHTANGYDFISIQRPTTLPLTNQRFN
ncbi:MAG: hypothetical protein WAT12_16940 [Candidatus Nitrotoga sp.]